MKTKIKLRDFVIIVSMKIRKYHKVQEARAGSLLILQQLSWELSWVQAGDLSMMYPAFAFL